jgi:hypothetical protein
MVNLSPVDLIKPVPPGVSWTAEPKSRPWSTPPKFVTLNDVAQGYVTNLSSAGMINSTLDAIETGVPLAALANAMMLSGVASGIHTIDTGILVIPIIVEMLKTTADLHGVKYQVFEEDEGAGTIPDRIVKQAMKKASSEVVEEVVEPQVELSGLMARKPKKMETM